jgi:hypothetical protein
MYRTGINLETVGMIFGRDPGVAYPHVRPYGSAKPRPAPGSAVAHPRFVLMWSEEWDFGNSSDNNTYCKPLIASELIVKSSFFS